MSITEYFQSRGVSDPSRYGVTETEAGYRIPIYSLATGEESGYEVRVTAPHEDGRKFTRPKGQAPSFNFAPHLRSQILDPKRTLLIVEGSTRHMALSDAGLPALSMQGCYGWRSSSTAILPEFEMLPLKGRKVVVGLDGDVSTKAEINEALRRLAQLLLQKGAAEVLWLDLPLEMGLDDWLAAGNSALDLPSLFRTLDLLPEIEKTRMSRARMAEKRGLPDTTDEALAELWVHSDPSHAVRIQGTDSWYTYVSGCWIADRTRDGLDARSSLAALLTQTADRFVEAAETDAEKKVAADVYRDLRSAGKLGAVYTRFRSLPAHLVTVRDEDFDRDPYLLNCSNGTLDLRTGILRPHDAADRLRGISQTPYIADAKAPRWTRFLDEVFPGRPDVIAYLQLILGASLIGRPLLHILPVLVGTGRNGKGTLIRALTAALGRDYMAACDNSLLITAKFEKHSTNVMALKGRRIVTASETEAGDAFATAALKRYTGGDELSARRMREDESTFIPTHSMILQTNHLPKVDVEDEALWARLRLIQFGVSFMDAPEPDLDLTLAGEAPGILAWLVAGCLRFISGGMTEGRVPDSVTGATTSWRVEDDQFAAFAEERLTRDPKGEAKSGDIQEAYKGWCDSRGEQMEYRGKRLGEALRRYGATDGRTATGRLWKGIRFRSEGDSVIITDSVIGSVTPLTRDNDTYDSNDGISSPSYMSSNPLHDTTSVTVPDADLPSSPSFRHSGEGSPRSQALSPDDTTASGPMTDDTCPGCSGTAWIDYGHVWMCQSCSVLIDPVGSPSTDRGET